MYGIVDLNIQHIEDTCQFVIRIQCFGDMILGQFDIFVTLNVSHSCTINRDLFYPSYMNFLKGLTITAKRILELLGF